MGAAIAAYPSLRIRIAPPVAWLLTINEPIVGLPDRAYMLTKMSLAPAEGEGRSAASWAWWDVGIRIGARHTNYGDASICSFEPKHHTWTPNDSIPSWRFWI